jgi:hypothetical protein
MTKSPAGSIDLVLWQLKYFYETFVLKIRDFAKLQTVIAIKNNL